MVDSHLLPFKGRGIFQLMKYKFPVLYLLILAVLLLPGTVTAQADEEFEEPDYCPNKYATLAKLDIGDKGSPEFCDGTKNQCQLTTRFIPIKAIGSDPENDVLIYNYKVSAGKIIGDGAEIHWDLTGVPDGEQTIEVCVDDGVGCIDENTFEVTIVLSETSGDISPKRSKVKDKYGFLFSGPVGKVDKQTDLVPNQPAFITNFYSDRVRVEECSRKSCFDKSIIKIFTDYLDPEDDVIVYKYDVKAGKIVGKGPNVKWDLSKTESGQYEIRVCADDGSGCEEESKWKSVTIEVY